MSYQILFALASFATASASVVVNGFEYTDPKQVAAIRFCGVRDETKEGVEEFRVGIDKLIDEDIALRLYVDNYRKLQCTYQAGVGEVHLDLNSFPGLRRSGKITLASFIGDIMNDRNRPFLEQAL